MKYNEYLLDVNAEYEFCKNEKSNLEIIIQFNGNKYVDRSK